MSLENNNINTPPQSGEQPPETPGVQNEKEQRKKKLAELIGSGRNPYENVKFEKDSSSGEIKDGFPENENKTVTAAGRILSRRDMGKANFIDIADSSGRIQCYVKIDDIGEDSFEEFKKWDIGDIIGVRGFVFKTRRGEISIHAKNLILLSKSLLPLPEKFHGLRDTDLRYRQRYVDLIVNPEVKETFIKRSRILSEIRAFLDSKGFIEVETPVLHTLEIGAAARPFITHHNTLDIPMYLRIETELHLKRLIVGGFEKVYEVGRVFRNEGMDIKHNPEFTMVELYQAYTDYHGMMDLAEELYTALARSICGSEVIEYQGVTINMASPWKRLTMAEAVFLHAGVDYYSWETDRDAIREAEERGVKVEGEPTKGNALIAFFEKYVEDKLIQPTFIYDYPVENSPLAKRKKSNPAFTERFEFFIFNREMGNAFSELNDPIDQRARFEKQVSEKTALGIKAEVDEDFINALEYGMPPTGGLGFGVDRLVMLLTDSASIRDVLLFPTMKSIER
ncbi:MAG: lysine--tRNA ligase [Eubacteriales bacterium]